MKTIKQKYESYIFNLEQETDEKSMSLLELEAFGRDKAKTFHDWTVLFEEGVQPKTASEAVLQLLCGICGGMGNKKGCYYANTDGDLLDLEVQFVSEVVDFVTIKIGRFKLVVHF